MRLFAIENLEPRRLLTGVTLITHGFGGSAAGWVTAMGDLIAQQTGPLANQPRYLLTVTDVDHDGGPLTVTPTRLGPASNWASRDFIVLVDWSDVAGAISFNSYSRPTGAVAAAVADQLLANYSIPDLAAPLASLPLHLIGHSRGASLVSELAKSLGQRGAWVDHLTFHDPHPVDGIREPIFFNLNFGDAAMRVYDNVQYADNFWRTDGNGSFDFTGESVNGAYNLQLNETTLTSGGYSTEHSDTHLWYHGTIGPPFSDNDGPGGASVGSAWYNAPQGPRDQVGWRASRIAGGARQSAGLKSSGAFRDALALTTGGANVWDNIQIDGMSADFTLAAGAPIPLNIAFQDRNAAAGGARDGTITYGLDRDDDPFNGVFSATAVATSTLPTDTLSTSIATANIAGGFRVYAKISNGVNTRYYYATGKAIITTPGHSKTWIGPSIGTWTTSTNWSPAGVPGASDGVSIFDTAITLNAAAQTTKITKLNLAGSATLDLGTKNLVIDYADPSPITSIRTLLTTHALKSTAADASGGFWTLADAEASDVLGLQNTQTQSFAGVTVDATSVLLRYTPAGDANLDGQLDGDDYHRIDTGYLASATTYAQGDFNRSGHIDADDYFLIDANYARQAAAPSPIVASELPPAITQSIWRREEDVLI